MDSGSIVDCKDRLQEQLQKAKESLKGVDDNLKKFISRNVNDVPLRSAFNKSSNQTNDKWKFGKEDNFNTNFRRRTARVLNENDIENIPVKKRLGPKVLHSSISGPPKRSEDDESFSKKPAVLSCVIAKPHVLPSRKEALSVKTYTETRARDRRMFGALLGTLQKFRQEETQLKDKEDKKAKVEKKLEEAAKREKEKIRLERQKLMDIRKQRESYIKAVENNMKLVKEQEQWEELQRPLLNYIRTESTPTICYLPKIHNEKTAQLLEECQTKLKKLIEERRESVKEEVDSIISQWKNVNIEEIMEKDEEHSPTVDPTETNSADNELTNGSWSMNQVEISWKSGNQETENLYSAKEERIRKKSGKTDKVSVKEEKEDDYEPPISVKQEKGSPIKMSLSENDFEVEKDVQLDIMEDTEIEKEDENMVAEVRVDEEETGNKSVDENGESHIPDETEMFE